MKIIVGHREWSSPAPTNWEALRLSSLPRTCLKISRQLSSPAFQELAVQSPDALAAERSSSDALQRQSPTPADAAGAETQLMAQSGSTLAAAGQEQH